MKKHRSHRETINQHDLVTWLLPSFLLRFPWLDLINWVSEWVLGYSMYVLLYIHIHIYIYRHMYVLLHMSFYICTYTCTQTQVKCFMCCRYICLLMFSQGREEGGREERSRSAYSVSRINERGKSQRENEIRREFLMQRKKRRRKNVKLVKRMNACCLVLFFVFQHLFLRLGGIINVYVQNMMCMYKTWCVCTKHNVYVQDMMCMYKTWKTNDIYRKNPRIATRRARNQNRNRISGVNLRQEWIKVIQTVPRRCDISETFVKTHTTPPPLTHHDGHHK